MRYLSIRGASSGKAGSGGAPLEVEDSIRSESYARVLDLISEGPILGFVAQDGTVLQDCWVGADPVVQGGAVVGWSVVENGVSKVVEKIAPAVGGSGYTIKKVVNGVAVASYGSKANKDYFEFVFTDPKYTGSGAWGRCWLDNGSVYLVELDTSRKGKNYTSAVASIHPAIGKSIYLNGTPLQDQYGNYSYKNTTVALRLGNHDQLPVPGFNSVENTITVDASNAITKEASKTASVDDDTADIAAFTVRLDSLMQIDGSTGDINKAEVLFNIYMTYSVDEEANARYSGYFLGTYRIYGKTASPYNKEVKILLTPYKVATALHHHWTFRIERVSSNPNNLYRSTLYWDTLTMISSNYNLSYPDSAIVGVQLNSKYFSSVPTRGYRMRLLMVQVPTNYFPDKHKYTRRLDGTDAEVEQPWDGSFYTAWTNNPAWIYYDMATNKRYGLGDVVETNPDIWALYEIGRYCDEMVPDGVTTNGKEPRFTCNVYFQERAEAAKVMTDLASVFRGLAYWGAGRLIPVQDRPKDPIAFFTNANVVNGQFQYSGTALASRHTVALVRWNDPAEMYRARTEYIPDYEGIARYGVRELQMTSFATTSRGQARRAGYYALYTERTQNKTITFQTGAEGAYLRPGDIVSIQDNSRSKINYAGRILRLSNDVIYTDRPITDLADASGADSNFSLVVSTPSDFVSEGKATNEEEASKIRAPQVTTITNIELTTGPEGNLAIKCYDPIPASVSAGAVWGLESRLVSNMTASVLTIEEMSPSVFEINALIYYKEKFDQVDSGLPVDMSDPTLPPNLDVAAPYNLVISDESSMVNGSPQYKVTLSWTNPPNSVIKEYVVYFKKEGGVYQYVTSTSGTTVEIPLTGSNDTYWFKVVSVGLTGLESSTYAEGSLFLPDLVKPAENLTYDERITGLELFNQQNNTTYHSVDATFVWRRNSAQYVYDFGSEPNGASSGSMSDSFDSYVVRVYDPDVIDNVNTKDREDIIYQGNVTEPRFVFTHEMNKQISSTRRAVPYTGIPYRSFVFEVRWRGKNGSLSLPSRLFVSNPRPQAITSVNVSVVGHNLIVTFPASSNEGPNGDFAGRRLWLSSDSSFVPSYRDNAATHEVAPVYEGTANPIIVPVSSAGTYHIAYAEYDTFSTDALDCEITTSQTTIVVA